MRDFLDLIYITLVLAVPFCAGVVVGRDVRKPQETWQHRIGQIISDMADDWRFTKSVVGEEVVVTTSCILKKEGAANVGITFSEAA